MKKQEAVYRLIHGLSEDEKKDMDRLILPDSEPEKHYQQLYRFFGNQPVYDEDQIKQASRAMGWDTSFHSTIKYLYDILIQHVSTIDEDQDKEAQIYSHFKYARALKNRGLYQLAIDEIKDALKLAQDYEWSSMVNEAAILRIIQLLDTEEFKLSKPIEGLLNIADASVKRIELGNKINQFYFRLANPIMARRENFEEKGKLVDKIITEWGEGRDIPDVDFLLRHRYCMLRYRCARHLDVAEDIRFWAEKGVAIFTEKTDFRKAHPKKYIQSLNLYNSCLYYLEDWLALEEQFKKLNKMNGANHSERAEIFQVYSLNQLQYWLNKTDLQSIDSDQLQQINQGLYTYDTLIRQNRRLTIIYHIGLIHFLRGEYKKASPIWDEGVAIKRKLERLEHIQRTILLLQLIVDFEHEHPNLDARAVTVRNRLDSWGNVTQIERILINGMRRLALHTGLESKKMEGLEELKKEYFEFIKEQKKNGLQLKQPLGEILFWLKGKYFPDLPDPRDI